MIAHFSNNLSINANQNYAVENIEYKNSQDISNAHFHNFYEIMYVYSGKRQLIVNNNTSTLDPCSIAFISPFKFHETKKITDGPFKKVMINFTYDLIKTDDHDFNQALLTCFNSPTSVITFEQHQMSSINNIFQNILYEYNSKKDIFSEQMIKSLITQFLLTASRTYYETERQFSDTQIPDHYSVILKIAEYIKNNYSKKISLDSLSQNFHINKFIISREFKSVIGASFIDYLNTIRIKRAQDLLINSDKTISEIAFECGFESIVHFNRTFKKQISLTPSDFLKNNKITL